MRKCLALALFALGLLPVLVNAQTATATIAISATVIKGCITVALPMAFGNYTSTSATPTTATASISVTCTAGTTYTVGLDAGTSTGATTATRAMTFSTHLLNYAIYRDSGHSLNWGNVPGTDTVAGTGTGLLQSLTAYGQISTGQYATTGAYTDLITISVIY